MAPRTVLRLNGLPLATPGADAAAPRAPGRRPRPLSVTTFTVSFCRSTPVATCVKRQERTCTYVPPNWDGGFCGEAQSVARAGGLVGRPPGRPADCGLVGRAVRCPRLWGPPSQVAARVRLGRAPAVRRPWLALGSARAQRAGPHPSDQAR